ncbi:hypothetical protein FRC12_008797 [Ceratobasidium sp. 428]|nr:hypothetical protein FRC12_008797 [Ceratobasidium sp. 428]
MVADGLITSSGGWQIVIDAQIERKRGQIKLGIAGASPEVSRPPPASPHPTDITLQSVTMGHQSNDNQPSLSARVFAISELTRIIYSFLDKGGRVNLLCLSRRFFGFTCPILWEEASFYSMLMLIPRVRAKLKAWNTRFDPASGSVSNLPGLLDTTRLDFYSPFVKTLNVNTYTVSFIKECQWPSSEARRPLRVQFPNMNRLIVHVGWPVNNDGRPSIEGRADWISKFLSPSLREFEIRSRPNKFLPFNFCMEQPWLEQDTCLELIEEVCSTCPALESLRIFSRECQPAPDARLAISERIGSLRRLRSLTLGVGNIGREQFQSWGQLPCLEKLKLIGDLPQIFPSNGGPIYLPDESFPALRRLKLYGIDPFTIQRIYGPPQLFRRLTTITIVYAFKSSSLLVDEIVQVGCMIKFLTQNSSRVTDLTVHIDGETSSFPCYRDLVHALGQMPLRRLEFFAIKLNPDVKLTSFNINDPALGWEDFHAAVPYLEELRLEGQTLPAHELGDIVSMFSELSLLELFHITLDEPQRLSNPVFNRPATSRPITIRLGMLGNDFCSKAKRHIPALARYIYSARPNVMFEIGSKLAYSPTPTEIYVINRLNDTMRSLRLQHT